MGRKIKLIIKSVFIMLLLLFFSSDAVDAVTYNYRKPIKVTNTGGELTDYNFFITIPTDDMLLPAPPTVTHSNYGNTGIGWLATDSDFAFSPTPSFDTGDWTASYNYWIEDGTFENVANYKINNATTRFWVRMNSLPNAPSGTYIYLYYGSTSTNNVSKTGTFHLFDNFDSYAGGTLTSVNWPSRTLAPSTSTSHLSYNDLCTAVSGSGSGVKAGYLNAMENGSAGTTVFSTSTTVNSSAVSSSATDTFVAKFWIYRNLVVNGLGHASYAIRNQAGTDLTLTPSPNNAEWTQVTTSAFSGANPALKLYAFADGYGNTAGHKGDAKLYVDDVYVYRSPVGAVSALVEAEQIAAQSFTVTSSTAGPTTTATLTITAKYGTAGAGNTVTTFNSIDTTVTLLASSSTGRLTYGAYGPAQSIAVPATNFSSGVLTGVTLTDTADEAITVSATATSYNTVTGTSSNITFDNTAPTFNSVTPAASTYINSGTVTFTLSEAMGSAALTFTSTTAVGGETNGATHVSTLSGAELTTLTSQSKTVSGLVNGNTYTLSFSGSDLAGNATTTAARTGIMYDDTAPTFNSVTPAASAYINSGAVTFTLSEVMGSAALTFTSTTAVGGETNGATHVSTLSGAELTTLTSQSKTVSGLVNGNTYTLSFSGSDLIGYSTTTAARTGIIYDTTAPTFNSVTPAASAYVNSGAVTFTLSEVMGSAALTFTSTTAIGGETNGATHVSTLSGAELTTLTSQNKTISGLVDGNTYTLSFSGSDLAGTATTTAARTGIVCDTTAPTATISYTAGWQSTAPISVTKSHSDTGGSGLYAYDLQEETATITNGTVGSYSGGWSTVDSTANTYNPTGESGKAYKYQYRAQDVAGNWSSYNAGGEIKIDTSAPDTYSNGLNEGTNPEYQYINGTILYYNPNHTGNFTVSCTPTDTQSGIQKVNFPSFTGFVSGGGDDATSPYSMSYSWDTGSTTNPGAKQTTAYNNAGTTRTSDAFTITKDSALPTNPSGLSTTPLATASYSTNTTPTLDWTTAGYDGLSGVKYEVKVNSGSWASFTNPGAVTVVSQLAANTIYIHAIDNVGNVASSDVSTTYLCDNTAPVSFELSSPADLSWTSSTTPTLSWNAASDNESGLSKYQLYINGSLNRDNISAAASSTTPTSALSSGSYTWYIKAVDIVGNTRNSTSTWTINVNTNLPVAAISYTAGWQSDTNISVTKTQSDPGGGSLTTYELQEATATITDGIVGNYSGWSTVDTTTSVYNTTGLSGTAYKYQYRVKNNAEVWSEYDAGGEIKIDTSAPGAYSNSLSEGTNPEYQYISGTILYYNPTYTGSFTVSSTPTDVQSSIQKVNFPSLGTGFSGGGDDSTSLYSVSYSWTTAATTSPGAKVTTAYNNANLTTTSGFNITKDSDVPYNPSGLTLDPVTGAGSYSTIDTPTFSWGTDGTDAGSGVQYQVRVNGGSWASFTKGSTVTVVSKADANTVEVRAIDNVGNVAGATVSTDYYCDNTLPTASISYSTGWQATTNISVTKSHEDAQSGIIDYDLQVATATISNGTVGIFSGWSQADATPTSPKTFTGTDGTAYKYKYRVQNGVGNWCSYNEGGEIWIDTTAPTAPTAVTFTPVGGSVVANTLNTTNTNFTAGASISAGQATGGSAELLKNGVSFSTPITDTSIAIGDTSVSFNAGFTTNAEVQAAFATSATLSVKLTDAAGNFTTSSVSNPAITVDYSAPTAPTAATFTPVGGSVVANTLNSTNTNFTAGASITAAQATGGSAELLKDGASFSTPITDTSIASGDTSVSFTGGFTTNAQVQAAFAASATVSVKLTDANGNSTTSSVNNPAITVDYSAPSAPSVVTFTPVGGTVVANTLNTTNTNFTTTASITAGQATGGSAELLKGGASFSTPITDTSISAGDTSVSFTAGFTTNAEVQAAFATSATLSVKLTDAAGNFTTSSVSNPAITVNYSALIAPSAVTFTAVGGSVVANTLNTTNTNFTATASITAGQATGGSAELLKDGVSFSTPITDTSISSGDTSVSFTAGFTTNAQVQSAFAAGATLSVKLTNAVGNSNTSSVSNPAITVDYSAPTAPTAATFTPVGGSVVANTLNTTNTNFTATASITVGQATGGSAELLKDGASFSTPITDTSISSGDTSVSFTAGFTTNAQVQSAFAASATVSVKLTDANGNSTTSSVSNPVITVDYSAPAAPTAVTFTPVGGSVVANALNTTNTNFTAVATITAGQATGGSAELLIDGASFSTPITDTSISSGDTSVSFTAGFTTNAQVQSAFTASATVSVKLTDVNGNSTTSSVSNPAITVNYSTPTAPTAVTFTPVGGSVVANALNTTNTNFTAVATITAGQATGGSAELLIDGASFSTPITDTSISSGDTSVSFTAGFTTNAQVQSAFATGATLSVKLTNVVGNFNTSSVSNPAITVDYSAPTAPTAVTFTPVGGSVVANTLNTTNTNFTATASITAGQATGGSAELLKDGASFSTPITDTSISSGNTSVSFTAGFTTNAQVQAAFATGATVSVKLTDVNGNATTSSVSNPAITVDYSAPTISGATIQDNDLDGSVDRAVIVFSEAVDDSRLTVGGFSLGGVAVTSMITGTTDDNTFTVTLTDGTEASGTDAKEILYTAATGGLTDIAGNALANVASGDVSETDGAAPILNSIAWTDVDGSTSINSTDKLLFTFSENMDTSTITQGNINTALALTGATTYGTSPVVDWDTPAGNNTLTVTLGTGMNIVDGSTVNPAAAVTDAAGNADATSVGGVSIEDNVGPSFSIAYYIDSDLSVPFTKDYMKAGAYYIKITQSSTLQSSPTVSIAAEGTANDVTDAATVSYSGNYRYTRTIGSDPAAVGSVAEVITITGTDSYGNVSTNAAVTGEKKTDTVSSSLNSIAWTDKQAEGAVGFSYISSGDELRFTFSEDMTTSQIISGNVNTRLPITGTGTTYGTSPAVNWTGNNVLTVTLGAGMDIVSGDTVLPDAAVTDIAGNNDATASGVLITDNVGPVLMSIAWTDADASTGFSAGDRLLFTFSENMDTSTITQGNINTALALTGATTYGTSPVVDWDTPAGNNTLTVTLGAGMNIVNGSTVNPAATVTDAAGNADATLSVVSIADNVRPVLNSIAWTDIDGSTTITAGDKLLFTFSENMDTSTITQGNINTALPLTGATTYGTSPVVDWATPVGNDTLTVTLGSGMDIVDGSTVNPAATVTDAAGNVDNTSGAVSIEDNVGPVLMSIAWTDLQTVGNAGFSYISAGDKLLFTFSENMNTSTITQGNINTALALTGATTYGTSPVVDWATPVGNNTLTVTLGTGVDIVDGNTVNPASAVTDAAGNADATSSGVSIEDNVSPVLSSIDLQDVDSSTTINAGDKLLFTFSENMDTSTITQANINTVLPIVGQSTPYGSNPTVDWATPAGNDTLTVTLTASVIVSGDMVNPSNAVKDVAGNIDATSGAGVEIINNLGPSFSIAYFTNAACTASLTNDFMKQGTYYIKITSSKALQSNPTISIVAEGTANDVTDVEVTDFISGYYRYTRTIVSDPAAVGSVPEIITITGTDTSGNLSSNAAVTGEKKTDTTAPAIPVSPGVSAAADGSYKIGDSVALTVGFAEIVTVTGIPTLRLETGVTDRNASYASGSGTNSLTFNYTVQAGDTSTDLDYVATNSLALSGGTIKDVAENNAVLTLPSPGAAGSLSVNRNIAIDNTAPTIPVSPGVSSTTDGAHKTGDIIDVTVTFSEVVNVVITGGTPTLLIETGTTDRQASYSSGSGTNTLTFSYTVQAGDNASDLDYVATNSLVLNGGTIKDNAGNNATLTLPSPGATGSLGANKDISIDNNSSTVSNVSAITSNGYYIATQLVAVTIEFSETVTVTGTPTVLLETGTTDRDASYASGSGTDTLTFNYTVQAGDNAADLDYVATNSLVLNGGTIKDGAGNNATLTLPSPGAAGSLGANKNLIIDTTAPDAPTGISFTGVGGNIVSNYLNNTNTNFTASAVVTADATGCIAELLKGGVSFSPAITDDMILSGDTSVSFDAGFTTNAQVQSAFATGATLSVKLTDIAGNSTTTSVGNPAITVDYTSPAAPTIGIFTPLGGTIVTSTLNSTNTGFTVSFTSPSAEYAGTAHLYVGGNLLANDVSIAVSAASTLYTLTGNSQSITDLGVDGAKALTVKIVDTAGNTGSASTAVNITKDVTAPDAPSGLDLSTADDSGTSSTDNVTNIITGLTFTGNKEANASLQLYDGASSVGSADTSAGTSWTIDLDLADGEHSITAKATDAAGNISSASSALAVSIVTTVPVVAVTIADAIYTASEWSAAATINGTFTAIGGLKSVTGLQVSIKREDGATDHYWNGSNWNATTQQWNNGTQGANTWTYSLASANLTVGAAYELEAKATDNIGSITTSSADTFVYTPILKVTRSSGSGSVTVGSTVDITITATDYQNNTVTSYFGDKSLTFSGPQAAPDATTPKVKDNVNSYIDVDTATTINFVNGIATSSLRAYLAQAVSLDVQDAARSTIASTGSDTYDLDLIFVPDAVSTMPIVLLGQNFDSATGTVAGSASARTAGTAFSPTIYALDQYKNVNTSYSGDKTLTWAMPTGTADAPSGTADVYPASLNFASGQASGSIILYRAQDVQLRVTEIGQAYGQISSTVTVNPATVASMIFSTQPFPTATTGIDFTSQPVITLYDAYTNICTNNSARQVTLSAVLASDNSIAGGGTLNGILTLTASSGVLTYSGLDYNKAENIVLKAVSAGITTIYSNLVAVSPATVASIGFSTPPSATATAGANFTAQPVITLYDANNNICTNDSTTQVTISAVLSSDNNTAGGATLNGTLTLTASSGVVTYSGLSYNKAENIDLKAVSSGLTTIYSNQIAVSPAATYKYIFNTPADITAGGARAAYTVTRYDQYDNLVTSAAETVYLYTSSTGASAAFKNVASAGSSIISVQIGNGSSSANFWYYDQKAGSFTITASDAIPANGAVGVADATDVLAVIPVSATKFKVTAGAATMTAGEDPGLVITIKAYDLYDNVDTNYDYDSTSPREAIFSGANSSPGPVTVPRAKDYGDNWRNFGITTLLTFVDGVSTSEIRLFKAEVAQIKATVGSIVTADSDALSITVSSSTVAGLTWGAQYSAGDKVIKNAPWKEFEVNIADQYGNVVSQAVDVTVTPTDGTRTTVGNTKLSSAGVARFTGFAITSTGTGAAVQLVASAGALSSALSNSVTVEDKYNITYTVKDSVSLAKVPDVTLTIGNETYTQNAVDYVFYNILLDYNIAGYTFDATASGYERGPETKIPTSAADGADGVYDNNISWTGYITSTAEATSDYQVKSSFVYTEPRYDDLAKTILKSGTDQLDIRVWLERRGKMVVNQEQNKLGVASVEIFDDSVDVNGTIINFTAILDDYLQPEADRKGIFRKIIPHITTEGTGKLEALEFLTSGKTYFARCKVPWGSLAVPYIHQSGTTFTITISEQLTQVTDTINAQTIAINDQVAGVKTLVTDEAALTKLAVSAASTAIQTKVTTETEAIRTNVTAVKTETAKILTAAETTLPAQLTAAGETITGKIKTEVTPHVTSGILNRENVVKTGDTIIIRYRTATGKSPKVDVYDYKNILRINKATMSESSEAGIYQYSVTFASSWGVGEFTVVCSESTLGTVDALVISIVSHDLEDVSGQASAILGSTSGISGLNDVASNLDTQFSSLEESLNKISQNVISKVQEAKGAMSDLESVFTELSNMSAQIKQLGVSEDINLEKLYEVSKDKKDDLLYLKNKTQELKAAMELNKKMMENASKKPVVQTWFEYR